MVMIREIKMNVSQLRNLIIRVLTDLNMMSDSAVNLLLGTAAQESHLKYIKQWQGPALGLFQMEPETEHDIWNNYLIYHPKIIDTIGKITGHYQPGPWLEWDLAYQIIMARLHYRRVKESLPNTLDGMAAYWKEHYNTPLGAGTTGEFKANYERFIGGKYYV